ncbi:MAG: biopolymer transporter ExbD [Phycisphaerae bacterium]|jgi:biopolymer transport protein ExbD|nr:biopolymer transporter ExbD [Phycisphaerae bacterium]
MLHTQSRLTTIVDDAEDRADITPLIDVIFMLLLFFIITMTFAEETFFPITLPQSSEVALRTPEDAAIIELSRDGKWALNMQFVPTRTRLYSSLQALKGRGEARSVIVKADENAPAGHVIWLQAAVRELGIDEMAWTTRPGRR